MTTVTVMTRAPQPRAGPRASHGAAGRLGPARCLVDCECGCHRSRICADADLTCTCPCHADEPRRRFLLPARDRSRWRGEDGAATLELVIAFPVLLLLIFSLLQACL